MTMNYGVTTESHFHTDDIRQDIHEIFCEYNDIIEIITFRNNVRVTFSRPKEIKNEREQL